MTVQVADREPRTHKKFVDLGHLNVPTETVPPNCADYSIVCRRDCANRIESNAECCASTPSMEELGGPPRRIMTGIWPSQVVVCCSRRHFRVMSPFGDMWEGLTSTLFSSRAVCVCPNSQENALHVRAITRRLVVPHHPHLHLLVSNRSSG